MCCSEQPSLLGKIWDLITFSLQRCDTQQPKDSIWYIICTRYHNFHLQIWGSKSGWFTSSGMWCCVADLAFADVLTESTAFICNPGRWRQYRQRTVSFSFRNAPPYAVSNGTQPLVLEELLQCIIVVKVLCYKSEGRWFDPSWCQWIFYWHEILLCSLWPWGRLSL